MKSAVTISLVPEARGGPFVFWDDLPAACRAAAELGFDAVEIFPAWPEMVEEPRLASALADCGLKVAAVGTGAGWVKHKLTLTDPDASVRRQACEFVSRMINAAARHHAPVIIGSMQGRWTPPVNREQALGLLRETLEPLASRARMYGVPLIYEPLNRYETNLCNTLAQGMAFVKSMSVDNVRLLADLFHMNIEETHLAAAIRDAGAAMIGHVHLADSNRRPAGFGHTDFAPIAHVLREFGYDGYVSAEALPHPDSHAAARATIDTFNKHFR